MSNQSTSNPKGFDAQRDGTGTHEWADHNENIQRGCSHNCKYCYAAANARRFKTVEPGQWNLESLTSKASLTRYPKRKGVIMFPTAHDITPTNLDACVRFLKLMLDAGNLVLVVTKPHYECMRELVQTLADYRDQIMFRVTLGTTSDAVAQFWEPGAPLPQERLDALQCAFEANYRTSVSAEPLLGGIETASAILDAVYKWVTDTIWIGMLNRPRQRVEQQSPEIQKAIAGIEAAQTPEKILALYQELRIYPKVVFKDSILQCVRVHHSQTTPAALYPGVQL